MGKYSDKFSESKKRKEQAAGLISALAGVEKFLSVAATGRLDSKEVSRKFARVAKAYDAYDDRPARSDIGESELYDAIDSYNKKHGNLRFLNSAELCDTVRLEARRMLDTLQKSQSESVGRKEMLAMLDPHFEKASYAVSCLSELGQEPRSKPRRPGR